MSGVAGIGSWELNSPTSFEWIFEEGALVTLDDRYEGVLFRIVERYRDYDAYPMYKIRFVGPHKGLSPKIKGRLPKTFRIRSISITQDRLAPAEPLFALAVVGLG